MTMKTIVFTTISLMAILWTRSCLADSWAPLRGVTSDGWEIMVLGEPNGSRPEGEMLVILSKGPDIKEFSENCTLEHNLDQAPNWYSAFTCSPSGSSPLAGARYESEPVVGKCDLVFKCVQGCKSTMPKQLVRTGSDCE